MSVKIEIRDNENIDNALRRFRKKVSDAGVIKDYKEKQRYEKKSDKLRRKKQEARRKAKQKSTRDGY